MGVKQVQESRKTKYTQTALKDSLIELMREKPISRITIKELCEKADINRTTFYAHYTDQFQLLKNIEDETLAWAKETIAGFSGITGKSAVMKYLEHIFEYLIKNINHVQVLMSEQGDIDFQRDLLGVMYEQCGTWLINDMNLDLVTSELCFVFIVNGSVGLIQHWLKTGMKETAAELSELIYNMTFSLRQQ